MLSITLKGCNFLNDVMRGNAKILLGHSEVNQKNVFSTVFQNARPSLNAMLAFFCYIYAQLFHTVSQQKLTNSKLSRKHTI